MLNYTSSIKSIRKLNFFHSIFFSYLRYFFIVFIFITLASLVSCDKTDFITSLGTINSLEAIITNGTIPNDINNITDSTVANTLGRVGANAGATISALYVTESGSGSGVGNSWNNAIAGSDLRTAINGINDASSSKVYVVLVGGGTYKTTTGTDRNLSFSMKNHTVIIGGFDDIGGLGVGSWTRLTGNVTAFDGDIGIAGDRSDNSYRVFHNDDSSINNTAVLYGAEIRNGYNERTSGNTTDNGGGMVNDNASPTVVGVTFISNYGRSGAGIFNQNSSPLIINSSFIYNESPSGGSAILNDNSSPIFVNTTISLNKMVNGSGGGIFNGNSSPTLVNVTIFNNSDSGSGNGGGIYSFSQDNKRGMMLINNIVWDNRIGNNVNQIFLDNNGASGRSQNIILLSSVLHGHTNDIDLRTTTNPYDINSYNVVDTDPSLGSLTTSGSRHLPISTGSSAINIGYHVKIDGTFAKDGNATGATLYYSEDDITWFTSITGVGVTGSMIPPSTAVYLTKYDVTRRERTGRPDAGAYEAR